MEFTQETYETIKAACLEKQNIEFKANASFTHFSSDAIPQDWTAFPPCLLPPDGYSQVFAFAGTDARAALTRLELLVHLDGGRILYKDSGQGFVAIRIVWPAPASA